MQGMNIKTAPGPSILEGPRALFVVGGEVRNVSGFNKREANLC